MAFDARNRIVWGDAGAEKLARSSARLFGLGGVGAACALDLVRAGLGTIDVVDFDLVQESNLNRLAFGFREAIGLPKVEAFKRAALSINPDVIVMYDIDMLRGGQAKERLNPGAGFYLDAIDALNPKVELLEALSNAGLPFASAMGTAGRIMPERLRVSSIWETRGCPLAQRVRQRLRRRGVDRGFLCVWSDEPAASPIEPESGLPQGSFTELGRVRNTQGSTPFVPQAAGHILASIAIRHILGLPLPG